MIYNLKVFRHSANWLDISFKLTFQSEFEAYFDYSGWLYSIICIFTICLVAVIYDSSKIWNYFE